MAIAESTPPKKGPPVIVQAGVLVVITLLAVGGGWFAGAHLRHSAPEEPAPVKVEPVRGAGGGHGEAKGGHGGEKAGDAGEAVQLTPRLVPLDPITTNLAAPAEMWVRMELSVVFSSPPPPDLTIQIHQDILAYMRTVTLQQMQGGSGFRHLKADLEERAQLRSGGLATRLMIRTLVFE